MKQLVDKCILSSWKFREPVCRDDYDGFANGMIEFQVQDTAVPALPATPTLPAESNAKFVWTQADHDWFHALR